jgi:YidC/Oxa1 family membrane protein insertase
MDILVSPMVNVLLFFYHLLGNSFVLSIVITTVLVRLITLPLTMPQMRSSRKMAALQPQLTDLKKKFGNDKQKFAEAQMKLYRENNVSMFGGCLPLILQMFIMIAFYQAITGALAVNPLQLLSLSHRAAPELASLIPIDSHFLWLNLGLSDQTPILMFLLPALVVVTTYLQQKLAAPPSGDPSAASVSKQMNIMMPMMFGLFALNFASGLSIYFIVSNAIGVAQYLVLGKRMTPAVAAAPAKASIKSAATNTKALAAPKAKK